MPLTFTRPFEENDAGGVPLDCPNSYKKVERKRLKKMRVPYGIWN